MTTYFIILLFGIFVGALFAFSIKRSNQLKIESQKEAILEKANLKSQAILEEAKSEQAYKESLLQDIQTEYDELIPTLKSKVENKETFLQKRQHKIDTISQKINSQSQELKKLKKQSEDTTSETLDSLSQQASQTIDEAKTMIENGLEKDFQKYFSKEVRSFIDYVSNISVKKAQEDLKIVMQKYTEPSSTDRLDKHLELLSPKECLRVAGKDNHNFEYIQEKLDVDIEIDEHEPNVVRVSGFILWKQEIAKVTIERLTKLPSIDENIIDKIIEQSTREMDQHLIKIGRQVAKDIHLRDLDEEFLNILGRLQYRTSYGQNILFHSFEVAYFCQIIASLLGEDPRVAFLAGFFHDVGKAIDQDQEGTHDLLGKELLERHGFDYEVYHPAHSHHYLVPVETTIGEIVIIADKISAGRPGARAESAEMYIERVKGLERIATEQEGVKKAYAISAGREIRTFLDENKVTDSAMEEMAKTIAHQIESELTYPGQIKVNLIRTIQASTTANKK